MHWIWKLVPVLVKGESDLILLCLTCVVYIHVCHTPWTGADNRQQQCIQASAYILYKLLYILYMSTPYQVQQYFVHEIPVLGHMYVPVEQPSSSDKGLCAGSQCTHMRVERENPSNTKFRKIYFVRSASYTSTSTGCFVLVAWRNGKRQSAKVNECDTRKDTQPDCSWEGIPPPQKKSHNCSGAGVRVCVHVEYWCVGWLVDYYFTVPSVGLVSSCSSLRQLQISPTSKLSVAQTHRR